jgi:hypothetical protein
MAARILNIQETFMHAKKPTPQHPINSGDHQQDVSRMKHCEDERLSKKAGYGRNTNAPNAPKK